MYFTEIMDIVSEVSCLLSLKPLLYLFGKVKIWLLSLLVVLFFNMVYIWYIHCITHTNIYIYMYIYTYIYNYILFNM